VWLKPTKTWCKVPQFRGRTRKHQDEKKDEKGDRSGRDGGLLAMTASASVAMAVKSTTHTGRPYRAATPIGIVLPQQYSERGNKSMVGSGFFHLAYSPASAPPSAEISAHYWWTT